MEPQVHAPGNMNLPPVASENYPIAQPPEQASSLPPETLAARPETAATPAGSMPPVPPSAPIDPVGAANLMSAAPVDVSSTTNPGAPAMADDGDLIEKEWVTKAKQIVEQTRENPHQQSQAMSGLKIDYLQKRYQKSVKLSG